jgi:hypothetical protein
MEPQELLALGALHCGLQSKQEPFEDRSGIFSFALVETE